MDQFTLPLALFNFLPVLLTAVGLGFLVHLLGHLRSDLRGWAMVGAALVVAGGLSKAIWKLLATLTGQDVVWLSNALFLLIGPGFILLAAIAWAVFRRVDMPPRKYVVLGWGLVGIALACMVAGVRTWGLEITRGWFLPFMLLTTLGNLGLMALLIRRGWQARQWGVIGLLLVNVLVVFALQPIAMAGADTLAMQWLEQVITALGSLCLAVALWLLVRAAGDSGDEPKPIGT
ncbi:hypothetical protein LRB11_15065 [Ectothiorhodospira haloalkaliphila]|uniref:hypothetical protein n=1 Tax=Ectothiorhodospira haloalkaliphila TaxID=421628 RepID=UPI001EE7CFC6|nr:hypothetical protein [Ectothiorhodospira haloalkaliphila]MCG5526235.1 hypothetical protein [Ectothiorhodospira haloalkaliphila]